MAVADRTHHNRRREVKKLVLSENPRLIPFSRGFSVAVAAAGDPDISTDMDGRRNMEPTLTIPKPASVGKSEVFEADIFIRQRAEARSRRMVTENLMLDWSYEWLRDHGPKVLTLQEPSTG